MPDEKIEQPEQQERAGDDSEAQFWSRFEAALDARLGEDRFDAALDRWAAKISAELPPEPGEKSKPTKKTEKQDGATQELEDDDEGESAAERGRASGRVGPGKPSGYWDRVGRRVLYGR